MQVYAGCNKLWVECLELFIARSVLRWVVFFLLLVQLQIELYKSGNARLEYLDLMLHLRAVGNR